MQDKVLVALKAEPRHCPADRWTTWARSLSERHERISARHGFLIMSLARPLRLFTSINQRWEKFVLALSPRIKVSIGPILQEMAHGLFRPVPTVGTSLTFPRVTILENRTISENYLAGARGDTDQRQLAAATGRMKSHDAGDFIFTEEARALNALRQSPLHRLFARNYGRDPAVVFRRVPFEKESRTIVERMVHERLRVEQRKPGAMVLRTQTISGASVKNSSLEMEAEFPLTAKARVPSWPEKAPEVDVEQLTEQVIRRIDHRITAYRERLGRAF